MRPVRLVARAGCWYSGKVLAAGELFFARAEDAPVLVTLKKADRAEQFETPVRAKRTYRRRDLQAESSEQSDL